MAGHHGEDDDDVEVGTTGIKISYVRFLSDSAAGYVALLVVFVALSTAGLIQKDLNAALAVAVFALLAIIATPVGLAINAFSWFTLCWAISLLELSFLVICRWISRLNQGLISRMEGAEPPADPEFPVPAPPVPAPPTPRQQRIRLLISVLIYVVAALVHVPSILFVFRPAGLRGNVWTAIAFVALYPVVVAICAWPAVRRCDFRRLVRQYDLDSDAKWFDSKRYESVLDAHFSKTSARIEYIDGGMTFLRSLAFIFLCLAIIRAFPAWSSDWSWDNHINASFFKRACVGAGTACLCISALTNFYRTVYSLLILRTSGRREELLKVAGITHGKPAVKAFEVTVREGVAVPAANPHGN